MHEIKWNEDWGTNKIVDGREWSCLYPHLPVGTFEEWCNVIMKVFEIINNN